MQTEREVIPVHRMESQSPLGLEFNYIEVKDEHDEIMMKSSKNVLHRDDYYMFLFMDDASALFTVDFEELELQKKSVLYVCPGQVHFATSISVARGCFLAIDPMLVGNGYKSLFEGQFATQKPLALDTSAMAKMGETARLLHSVIQAEPTIFGKDVILSLANVFIGVIAEQYASQKENTLHNKSRSAWIAHRFKRLLTENYKSTKSPSEYAKMLNYSLSHLNESVKSVTGFTVSHWIHQQVTLEAKRLLYYTDLDVKEIAFRLGYEDHTYFSRLFSKTVGMPPGTFRCKFHE
ncbi:AraC-like DNA-binding protein [Bacteroides reticulotermitis]|uniref:AraC-like DNA-binding protein n=2 Tax=Bacteroides reticulotermitis TaxID=1133319 RepID=A0A840D6G5_9BACE|nr:helix-turn-helix domain-containing protein [Bacteroides reticulotermitis]MBB4046399.1 AraC-like DNA-binding protein [Bacteroides reticulotermitis]